MKLLRQIDEGKEAEPPRLSVLGKLGLENVVGDSRQQLFERMHGGGRAAVEDSSDLQRIIALPRRPRPALLEQKHMAEDMTARLRLPDGPCDCSKLSKEPCIKHLLPIQGWYLFEAAQQQGALGHIVVGGGKTGIDILLPMVFPGIKRAVLLIPPGLKKQFLLDYKRWSQHFKVPNLGGHGTLFFPGRPVLDLLAYSELSHESCATWFKNNKPDLVIADECQALKDKSATRTFRFLNFFSTAENDPRACAHSGSMTTRSPDDYAHLSALALREGSPLPLDPTEVNQWSAVVGPGADLHGPPMGALRQLCRIGENIREGFCRRLLETPGVISTGDADLPTRLRMHRREPGALPAEITRLLTLTRATKTRPDGEEFVEAVEVVACCRQLASGFYYRWKYPRGEPAALIEQWFSARQAWARELRLKLERRSTLLDSPGLCEAAAMRFHSGYSGPLPVWASKSWPTWAAVKEQVRPEKDTVWLDDFLVVDAAKWMGDGPGIVWCSHSAVAHRLAKLTRAPMYGPSASVPVNLNPTPAMRASRAELLKQGNWLRDDCEHWVSVEDGSRSIIASLKAHGTGRNLQAFNRMLFANVPSDGGAWEQALGRSHRRHQKAPSVAAWVYQHTPELRQALADAKEFALYTQQTTLNAQKLLIAEYTF